MDECKPLATGGVTGGVMTTRTGGVMTVTRGRRPRQVLTLVHLSSQLERFVWDRGCAYGLCSPC
jgi:hypothetical protein